MIIYSTDSHYWTFFFIFDYKYAFFTYANSTQLFQTWSRWLTVLSSAQVSRQRRARRRLVPARRVRCRRQRGRKVTSVSHLGIGRSSAPTVHRLLISLPNSNSSSNLDQWCWAINNNNRHRHQQYNNNNHKKGSDGPLNLVDEHATTTSCGGVKD